MERSKAMLAVSSSPLAGAVALPDVESQVSTLLYDVAQQVQMGMQNLLKKTSEIDQSSGEIVEEIEKCKESASETTRILEEEKERVNKVAIAVIEMLNGGGVL